MAVLLCSAAGMHQAVSTLATEHSSIINASTMVQKLKSLIKAEVDSVALYRTF